MSMPSSRLDVATRHGMRPAFRSSSTSTRCSRASEPWWARAISRSGWSASPPCVRELVQAQREPLGEPAVVDEHDRRAVLLDERAGSRGRSTARSSCAPRSVPTSHLLSVGLGTGSRSDAVEPSSRMSSTGTTTSRSSSLRVPASTSVDRAAARRRSGRSPRAAAASPRARSAASAASTSALEPLDARAPGARRASCRRPRAPRRGSASRRRAASRAPAR